MRLFYFISLYLPKRQRNGDMGASFEGGEKLSSAYGGMFFISVIFACHCLYARRLQNNVRFVPKPLRFKC